MKNLFFPDIVSDTIPLYSNVAAGFASPAEDHYEEQLNLNNFLIANPARSSFIVAQDNGMYASGISEGDILVVEQPVNPPVDKVVVAKIGDELHIKRITRVKDEVYLTSDSLKYPPLKLVEVGDYEILGVVKFSIHSLRNDFYKPKLSSNADIHSCLVNNPVSTYFVRVSGNSMIKAGIFDNDILIVDRSILPTVDQIVIAYLDGGFTVKRLKKAKVNFILFPENDDFPPLEVTEEMEGKFWGVVTFSIHKVK